MAPPPLPAPNPASRPPLGLLGAGVHLAAIIAVFLLTAAAAVIPWIILHPGLDLSDPNTLKSDGDFTALFTFIFFLLAMTVTAITMAIRPGPSVREQLAIRKPALKWTAAWTLAIIALAVLSDEVFKLLGIDPLPPWMVDIFKNVDHLFLFFLAVVILAPLTEETVFRGVIFGAVERRLGPVWAIVISTAPWSLMHVSQYEAPYIVLVFVLGLLLGAARLHTRSLYVSFIMHAANNLLALVQVYGASR